MRARAGRRGLTAFVREVVMPGGPDAVPRLRRAACRFRLRHGRSRIHRWGIFAAEAIPARRRVIEYLGERIGPLESWRRRVRPRIYLFWVSTRVAIDGAVGGSGAEFINHSCQPNLLARVHRGRVHLVSLRPIATGDELLIDYRLRGDLPLVPCRCGAAACRGYLNRPDDPRLAQPSPGEAPSRIRSRPGDRGRAGRARRAPRRDQNPRPRARP